MLGALGFARWTPSRCYSDARLGHRLPGGPHGGPHHDHYPSAYHPGASRPGDGLPDNCAANLDSIQTVRKSHIGPRIATLGEGKLAQIDRALLFALGMERYGR